MPELLAALERAGKRLDRWLVVLWTWLEPQLAILESREKKLREIRTEGLRQGPEQPDLAAALSNLRSSTDLLSDAAAQLVALELWVAADGRPETIRSIPVEGFDGTPHLVAPRQRWLVRAFWEADERGRDEPPAAAYAPSIAILAPRLIVVPAIVRGIALENVEGRSISAKRGMARARQRFARLTAPQATKAPEQPSLIIHLATLGPNLIDGFVPDPEREVFHYADPSTESANNKIARSLEEAVGAAAEASAAILVLPEFSVPVGCLDSLKSLLSDTKNAPALTVAGMRHEKLPDPLDNSNARMSEWVNEAVILADDGSEIFRHRKLTAFRFEYEGRALQEDTRPGTRLPVLRTDIGNIAVVTCLDAFGTTVDRLRESHASIVLVPSLSPSVSPHRAALTETVRWLWGAAFVCNRDPLADGEDAWLPKRVRSFWSVAYMNTYEHARQPEGSSAPTLIFDLAADARKVQSSSTKDQSRPISN